MIHFEDGLGNYYAVSVSGHWMPRWPKGSPPARLVSHEAASVEAFYDDRVLPWETA